MKLVVRVCSSVTWLMARWKKSRSTILGMLERGEIVGYRRTPTAKWLIDEEKVLEYEATLERKKVSSREASRDA